MPARPLFSVNEPEVRYALTGGPGYMFPRPDGIILGGTFERNVWSTVPEPSTIERIVRGHKRFFESFLEILKTASHAQRPSGFGAAPPTRGRS